jgi:hypothetical protein
MQLAADHKTWLQTMAKSLPEEEARECRCLEVEYFIMRTALVRIHDANHGTILTIAVLGGKQA